MKKVIIFLSLAFLSCGKVKQQQILIENKTDIGICIKSDKLGIDTEVDAGGGQYLYGNSGKYSFTAFTSDGSVNYTQNFKVKHSSVTIELHK